MEITLQYVDERIMTKLKGIVDIEWKEFVRMYNNYRIEPSQIGRPYYVPANAQEVQENLQAVQYQWCPLQ